MVPYVPFYFSFHRFRHLHVEHLSRECFLYLLSQLQSLHSSPQTHIWAVGMLTVELILRVHRRDVKKHQSHLFFSSLGKHERLLLPITLSTRDAAQQATKGWVSRPSLCWKIHHVEALLPGLDDVWLHPESTFVDATQNCLWGDFYVVGRVLSCSKEECCVHSMGFVYMAEHVYAQVLKP